MIFREFDYNKFNILCKEIDSCVNTAIVLKTYGLSRFEFNYMYMNQYY